MGVLDLLIPHRHDSLTQGVVLDPETFRNVGDAFEETGDIFPDPFDNGSDRFPDLLDQVR